MEKQVSFNLSDSPRQKALFDYLNGVQYGEDIVRATDSNYQTVRNLGARWDFYAHGEHAVDLEAEFTRTLALNGNETILDVGASDGRFLSRLANEYHHNGQLIGVEPNASQLINSRYWKSVQDGEGVHYVSRSKAQHAKALFFDGYADDIALDEGSVDVITALFMMYHVPTERQQDVVASFRNLLGEQGRLVVTTSAPENKEQHRRFEKTIAELLSVESQTQYEPPAYMTAAFTSDRAITVLKDSFKYVYNRAYNDVFVCDSEEKVTAYRASLLSMYDQFRPLPDPGHFTELVDYCIDAYIRPRMRTADPFTETIARETYIASDTPQKVRQPFQRVYTVY